VANDHKCARDQGQGKYTFENKTDIYLDSVVTPTLSVMTTSSVEST